LPGEQERKVPTEDPSFCQFLAFSVVCIQMGVRTFAVSKASSIKRREKHKKELGVSLVHVLSLSFNKPSLKKHTDNNTRVCTFCYF
jgi:hypothetical protein